MKKLWRGFCFTLLILMVISSSIALGKVNPNSVKDQRILQSGPGADYWPKAEWRRSTPEEQGMDSEKIYGMMNFLHEEHTNIHSLLIVRNGYLITEAYFYPYQKSFKHNLYSCTKSITSALIGKAIDEGYLKSVNEKVLPYFSDVKMDGVDSRKEAMTIKHLLTMTTGLDWFENNSPGDCCDQMFNSVNPFQYFLDRPMKAEPGKEFHYNSGASHVLSGIIQKATGKSSLQYGQENLFGPMGISDYYWRDINGGNTGGFAIYMTPADAAKFGYLCLKGGKWDGRQIIPETWIEESTQKYMETPQGPGGGYGYGYQWWMNGFGGYSARGYGGQYIFVLPRYQMVIAFTSGLSNEFLLPETLVDRFIIPAVKSSAGLKPNVNSNKKLADLLKTVNLAPPSQPIPQMPPIAEKISGKTFTMEDSSSFSLRFQNGNECWVNWFEYGMNHEMPVGLDGVYRMADIGNLGWLQGENKGALKGFWNDEKTFIVTMKILEEGEELNMHFEFDGDQAQLFIYSTLSGFVVKKGTAIMQK